MRDFRFDFIEMRAVGFIVRAPSLRKAEIALGDAINKQTARGGATPLQSIDPTVTELGQTSPGYTCAVQPTSVQTPKKEQEESQVLHRLAKMKVSIIHAKVTAARIPPEECKQ